MSDVTSTTSRGPSRRTVVRTAAHAAWAVPAIQIATSAPAFAVSTVNELEIAGTPAVIRSGPDSKSHYTYQVSNVYVWNDGGPGGGLLGGALILTFTGLANGQAAVFTAGSATTTGLFSGSTLGSGNPKTSVQYTSNADSNPVPVGASPGTAIIGTFTFKTAVALTSLTISATGGSFTSVPKALSV